MKKSSYKLLYFYWLTGRYRVSYKWLEYYYRPRLNMVSFIGKTKEIKIGTVLPKYYFGTFFQQELVIYTKTNCFTENMCFCAAKYFTVPTICTEAQKIH